MVCHLLISGLFLHFGNFTSLVGSLLCVLWGMLTYMLLVNTEIKEQTIQLKKMTIFPMFLLSKKKKKCRFRGARNATWKHDLKWHVSPTFLSSPLHFIIELHSYMYCRKRNIFRICCLFLLENTPFTKCKEKKIINLFDHQNKDSLCSHDQFCSSEQIKLALHLL